MYQELTLEESVFGVEKELTVKKSENNVEKWEKWKNEKPLHGRVEGKH